MIWYKTRALTALYGKTMFVYLNATGDLACMGSWTRVISPLAQRFLLGGHANCGCVLQGKRRKSFQRFKNRGNEHTTCMKHPTFGAKSYKNRNHDTLCYAGATPALREKPCWRAVYCTASAILLSLLLTCCTPCEPHDPWFSYGSSLENVWWWVGGIYQTLKVIRLGMILCWSFWDFNGQGKSPAVYCV